MAQTEIALIGGSGFIGRNMARLFEQQSVPYRIIDIAKPEFESRGRYVHADVQDPGGIREAIRGCNIIVNLAAAHRDDVRPASLYYTTNVDGAKNICDAATALGITRILFTSSVAIYGFLDNEATEETPANPFNHYGKSKWEAEAVFRPWQEEDPAQRALVIVRPCVVFGPENRGNVFNLLAQISGGRFVMVGDGKNRKSMAYVENIAAFLVEATLGMTAGLRILNYADKPDLDMNELLATVRGAFGRPATASLRLPYWLGMTAGTMLDIVARLTGRTFPVSRIRVEKFCANTLVAANRLRESGFHPPYSLRQGLVKTLRHEFPGTKIAE
jgi:nucleoside-diphosphate-sugar epimerase